MLLWGWGGLVLIMICPKKFIRFVLLFQLSMTEHSLNKLDEFKHMSSQKITALILDMVNDIGLESTEDYLKHIINFDESLVGEDKKRMLKELEELLLNIKMLKEV